MLKPIFAHTKRLINLNFCIRYQNKNITSIAGTLIKSYEEIPGPKMYPFIGNLLDTKEFG